MQENDENKGYVYVLSNYHMPGIVKIGMTTRGDAEKRAKELYSTGVPVQFNVEYACKVPIADCAKIEAALHIAFDPHRVNKHREFFKIKPDQAIAILSLFDNKLDATKEFNHEIEAGLTNDDKEAQEKARRSARKKLNYLEMGIPIGARLCYILDPSISVEVVTGRTISYLGEIRYLTSVTMEIRGITHSIQPTPYWSYDGRNLQEIYDETYPLDDGEEI